MITNGTVRNMGEPDYSHRRVICKQPENGRMWRLMMDW